MRLVKPLLAALFVCALVGYSPDWNQAAEITKQPPPETQRAPSQTKLLDINTASIDDLKALPGIGDVYAFQILAPAQFVFNPQVGQLIIFQPTVIHLIL